MEVMRLTLKKWTEIAKSLRNKSIPQRLFNEGMAIKRSLDRTAQNWSPERNYRKYLLGMAHRIQTS